MLWPYIEVLEFERHTGGRNIFSFVVDYTECNPLRIVRVLSVVKSECEVNEPSQYPREGRNVAIVFPYMLIKHKINHDLSYMDIPLILVVWIGHEVVGIIEVSELRMMNTGQHYAMVF